MVHEISCLISPSDFMVMYLLRQNMQPYEFGDFIEELAELSKIKTV